MQKIIFFSITSLLIFTGCASSSLYFVDKESCDKAIEVRNILSPNDTIRPRDIEWKDGKCFSKEPTALSCDAAKGRPARAAELREIIALCGGTLTRSSQGYIAKNNLSNESYQNCIKQHHLTDKYYQTIDGMDMMVFEMDKGYETRSTPKEKMPMLCTSNKDNKSLLRPLIAKRWAGGYTKLQEALSTPYSFKNIEELLNDGLNPLTEETIMYYERSSGGSSYYLYGKYSLLKYYIEHSDLDYIKLIGEKLTKEQIQSQYFQEMTTYSQESYKKDIYTYLQELKNR